MDTFDEKTMTMVYSDGSGRAGIMTGAGGYRYERWKKKYVYAMVLGRMMLCEVMPSKKVKRELVREIQS